MLQINDYVYGWDNGKPALDKWKLTNKEKRRIKIITEIAFREMGERTRMGSGDDQYYVDQEYEHLKSHSSFRTLIEVVFMLLKQRKRKRKKLSDKFDKIVAECCKDCEHQIMNITGTVGCEFRRWPDRYTYHPEKKGVAYCSIKDATKRTSARKIFWNLCGSKGDVKK